MSRSRCFIVALTATWIFSLPATGIPAPTQKNVPSQKLDEPERATVDPFPNPKLAPTDAAGLKKKGARFGCSRNNGTKMHKGIDLKADVGTNCKSIYKGEVKFIRKNVSNSEYSTGVGNYVIVRTSKPNVSVKYCHLSEVSVKVGDIIQSGAALGKTGKSGNAFNVPHPHVHIVVSTDHFLTDKKYVDPEPYLKTTYGTNPNPVSCSNIRKSTKLNSGR